MDYFLNEFTQSPKGLDNEIYIVLANMTRRVMLCLAMLHDNSFYSPKNYISFEINYIHSTYSEDDAFACIFTNLLKKYNWTFPEGWNCFIENADQELTTYHNFDERVTSTVCTLHNPKFDKVYTLYKTHKENIQLQKEGSCIINTIRIFIQNPFLFEYIHHSSTQIVENKVYLSTFYDTLYDAFGNSYTIDIRRFFDPKLVHILPDIDKKMDSFLFKWEKGVTDDSRPNY